MMTRLIILAVLLVTLRLAEAEEKELTREQMLAALVFKDVTAVHITELVMVQIGKKAELLPREPWKEIEKHIADRALRFIANPATYHFDGGAMCFDPGMRIMILEKQRKLTLDVCLLCSKMTVEIEKGPSFTIDFSEVGLACFRAIHLDFMGQKKIRH